jgi:hypothetical protein
MEDGANARTELRGEVPRNGTEVDSGAGAGDRSGALQPQDFDIAGEGWKRHPDRRQGSRPLLYGGTGADTFRYTSVADSRRGLRRRDIIKNLNANQGDRIDLRPIDANTRKPKNQAFRWIGNRVFTGVPGQLRYARKKKLLQGDVNGDRRADLEIKVIVDGKLPGSAIRK